MATEFSRTLSLLRRERGVSQRTAAADLGVSQALLSHYENGIREPGLPFVVRACDYYNVSADFMLGRTLSREGSMLTAEEILGAADEGNVLRGSRNKQILERKLDELSTYGLLKSRKRSEIHAMIDHLEGEGYLEQEPDTEFPTLRLSVTAGQVLYHGQKILMKVEIEPEEIVAASVTVKLTGSEEELFDALKELRMALAKKAGVPAYVVFSNATLSDMAKKRPKNMTQFKKISGVGEIKAAWYGSAFLKCIRDFEKETEG